MWLVDGTGLQGRSCLAIGQSELPGDPHRFDQGLLWVTGQVRDAALSTPAVPAALNTIYP